MNIIQTLYINGDLDPFANSFGWAAPEYHLMSWALSCLQLRKFYPSISIHTNSAAANLLIDILKLPYKDVHITHNDMSMIDPRLWALPKIHTYSLQRAPFLHIDGDVFIFKKFDNALLANQLIAQNIEEATDYYTSTQNELLKYFGYFPTCVEEDFKSDIQIRAINAGILGGHNVQFIEDYAKEAYTYINNNLNKLDKINVDRFNVFYEQHLFYSLAHKRNLEIGLLFPDVIKDNKYKYLGNFHKVPYKNTYLHLLGHFKKDSCTCIQMAYKLRQLYPEYYYRIVGLFAKKSNYFFINYSNNIDFDHSQGYDVLHNKANNKYDYVNNEYQLQDNIYVKPNISSFIKAAEIAQSALKDLGEKLVITNDQTRFVDEVEIFYKNKKFLDFLHLYGRDLNSINWYNRLFAPNVDTLAQFIVRCDEVKIIVSEFDWACMFNNSVRVGVEHYLNFEFIKGIYYNLIIPEVHQDSLSIYDIDESEKMLLDCISEPIQIAALLGVMRGYADEEAQEHQVLLDTFFLTLIKQLVLKKAIKPVQPLKS